MTSHPTCLDPAPRKDCACVPCRCCGEHTSACELECLQRPLFTKGMVLSDSDLTALVEWTRSRLALRRYRDGWGVVCGLDVRCLPDRPGMVVVDPGYAVGCCGEDLVLCEPTCVDLNGCCAAEEPCPQPEKNGETTGEKTGKENGKENGE